MEYDRSQVLTIRQWRLPTPVRVVTWVLIGLAAMDWLWALADHNVSGPACRVGAVCRSSGGLPITRVVALVIGGALSLTLVGMLRSRRQAFFITAIMIVLTLDWVINGLIAESTAQSVALQAVNILILVLLAMGGRSYMDLSNRTAGGARRRLPESQGGAAAGWHPDPSGRHQLRYWDGSIWTDHVSTEGTTGIDPL